MLEGGGAVCCEVAPPQLFFWQQRQSQSLSTSFIVKGSKGGVGCRVPHKSYDTHFFLYKGFLSAPTTHTRHTHTRNMPPVTRARANWAVGRANGLPEVWALVAVHLGLVGAWRVMRVCKAARVGAKEFLSTLPGLVVCGGYVQGGRVRDVLRLDLATLRWEPMPSLVTARDCHIVRSLFRTRGGRGKVRPRFSYERLNQSESF
jgi:hypothetical protein